MKYVIKTDLNNLAPLIELINTAYRGVGGRGRWTTESHLIQGDRISCEDLSKTILDERIDFVVGSVEDKTVACIAIKRHAGFVEFGTFAVDPELHGSGLGGELLNYAESIAAEHADLFQVVVVSQNKNLIEFYKRRNYQDTGRRSDYPVHSNVGRPKVKNIDLILLQKHVIV